jgi:hypothetical protein
MFTQAYTLLFRFPDNRFYGLCILTWLMSATCLTILDSLRAPAPSLNAFLSALFISLCFPLLA